MCKFVIIIPPGGAWLNEVREAREAARREARRLKRKSRPPKVEKEVAQGKDDGGVCRAPIAGRSPVVITRFLKNASAPLW